MNSYVHVLSNNKTISVFTIFCLRDLNGITRIQVLHLLSSKCSKNLQESTV